MSEILTTPPPISPRHLKQASLSFSQEAIWFLQQLDPENTAYNLNHLFKFTGGIDPISMERALNELVNRHEPFRTVYPNQRGKPVQVIQPFEPFSLTYMDYSELPESERQPAVLQYVSDHGDKPFDLQRGPLVRFAVLHTSHHEDYLLFCTHHIGSDAWSRQIYIDDLMQLYDAFYNGRKPSLPELPIQYADYAVWQRDWLRGETLQAYIKHWKETLSSNLPVLEIPTDHPRPIMQSFRGGRYHFKISSVLLSRVKEFCLRERMTPFHLYLAAYALLIMRHTGQDDIVIGCPFANRLLPQLDEVVGFFVNTLPLRVTMKGNPSIREFLDRVRTVMLDAYPWQAAPFEALVSEITPQRDLSRTPVFQVVINMRNVPNRETTIKGLEMESQMRDNAPSPFDLSMEFDEDKYGNMNPSLQYNADLFDENTIIHMVAHFQNLLGELILKTNRPLSGLEMLTPSERQRVVMDWNDTGRDFPPVCIHDLFSEQAEKNPGGTAVICDGKYLSYSDLEKKTNQLAHYLRANGVGEESRVGIYLPRSEMIVVAILGILKAGGAYVPLDMTYPAGRISFMLEDSSPDAIIALSNTASQLPNHYKKICLDTDMEAIQACKPEKPAAITNNESLAYLIYTSGSTGQPKGAMILHKGIVNFLTYMKQKYQFNAKDRFIQLTSLSFDLSVLEILGTLTCGGMMVIMDDDQMRNPEAILSAVEEHQATIVCCVPTMLRALSESAFAGKKKYDSLRIIIPAGEALMEADVALARKAFGDSIKLINLYGPTECSVSVTDYLVPSLLPNELQVVPIGKPIGNARTYILDDYQHPVPAGAKGELYIGGISVGRGYWNRPDLTTDKFLADPFHPGGRMYRTGDMVRQLPDGTICFLGRSDDQVKIRGYRVELGEIEAVVNKFPGIKEAAVILWRKEESEILAAYVTILEGQNELKTDDLHAYLADHLPFYMLPSSFTVLKEMPLNPNGKIDRRSLPHPDTSMAVVHNLAPRNDFEKRLVSIWKENLGVDRVGIRDNYFELGGHSLLAVRLFAKIQEEFGQSLPLKLLFLDGTVEALARVLSNGEESFRTSGIVPIQPKGSEPPLFIISAGLYLRQLALAFAPERPVYGVDPVETGKVIYRKSIQETAKIHYQNLVEFQPQGPYSLVGHSAEGYYALELARLLIQQGHEVAFLGLLDTFPPGYNRQANLLDRLKIHLGNLQDKNLPELLQYAGGSARRFSMRMMDRFRLNPKMLARYEKKEQTKEVKTLLRTTYKPEPYEGKVMLFAATHRPWYFRWDPLEPWEKYITGNFEIVPVPGDHISMLQPPQVTLLAEKIKEHLPRNV